MPCQRCVGFPFSNPMRRLFSAWVGEWTLYFFNPVEKPFAEEEPPLCITGDFPDVTVRIYDDGRVELVSG